uniref:NADH-ubiquinone oxidoreductase chain 3 n=1 Tax=Trigonopteryx hopei TaxID=62799 RepID=M4JCA1_9ORTH|nr:NADH dehydrogenase subunit 3 [Trigonopteryx hopei]
MKMMFSSMIMSIIITMIIMTMNNLLSSKLLKDREKMSPFECGFDPKSSARMPFSSRFFLIGMMFLIFDIEIVLMLPAIITLKSANIKMWSISMFTFLLILIIGLYHEWNQGSIKWAD